MSTLSVQNFYPEFVDNQILNKTQLNQLRAYLDGQNRETRVRLTGIGIVCGLHAKVQAVAGNPTIHLSEGYGVTSDGFLIKTGALVLDKMRAYRDPYVEDNDLGQPVPVYEPWKVPDDEIDVTDPDPDWQIDIIELMPDPSGEDGFVDDPLNPIEDISPGVFDDRVLVLYLEYHEDPLYSCLITDCNNKGYNLQLHVRALLVEKERLNRMLPCEPLEELISIPRFYAGLRKTAGISIPDISNSGEINAAYQDIADHLRQEIVGKVGTAIGLYNDLLCLEAYGSDTDLDNAITGHLSAGNSNQYHFDFLKDLAQTYNEFAQLTCSLVKRCSFSDQICFPRHLMIRDFVENNEVESAKWRNRFMAAAVRNVMHDDLKKAQQLFKRIFTLAEDFTYTRGEGIKVTPSEHEAFAVAKRALPYYYVYSQDTAKSWQLNDCCAPPLLAYAINDMQMPGANYLSGPNNPLTDQIRQHSFLRIEGHLEMQCRDALDMIQNTRLQHNLDFDVVTLLLNSNADGSPDIGEDPEIEQIKEYLEKNKAQRRELERLAETLFNRQGNNNEDTSSTLVALITGFGQINERNDQIEALNEEWMAKRKAITPPCDISHLASDYLLLRSEAICIYDKMDDMLSFLAAFDDTLESLEQFNAACVDFDSADAPDVDTAFDLGQEVVTEENIRVTTRGLETTETDNNLAQIVNAGNNFGEGKALFLDGRRARFDFTGLDFPPSFVLLEFQSEVDFVELYINEERLYDGPISELDSAATGDIGITVNYNLVGGTSQGLINITGTGITSMAIGGNRFTVDNICALGAENMDIVSGLVASGSVNKNEIEAKKQRTEARIVEIQGINMATLSDAEQLEVKNELFNLKKERESLAQTSNLITINESLRRSFIAGNQNFLNAGADRRKFLRARAAISFQSSNQSVMILVSLIYALIHLRMNIKGMLKRLPKDIRCFNYCLFIERYKAIIATMIQVRMLLFCVVELLLQNAIRGNSSLGNISTSIRQNPELLQIAVGYIPKIQDVLTYWKKALHNCLHARFNTLYYTLEHTLLGGGDSWQQFTRKHIGMEHLAGVGFGDTFILVCEEQNGRPVVVADFTVSAVNDCCCELDADDICFPPVALPNYEILNIIFVNEQLRENNDFGKTINVLGNDFGLNDAANLTVILPADQSALGARLKLNDEQEIVYDYTEVFDIENVRYGLDTFEYTLRDEECGVEDTGQVMMLVKPIYVTQEDDSYVAVVGTDYRGRIVDDATNEPLIGVNVLVEGTATGTVTDIDGSFRLQQDPGQYNLVISYIGYQQRIANVTVQQEGPDDLGTIRLRSDDNFTNDEVVVVAGSVSNLFGVSNDEAIARVSTTYKTRFEAQRKNLNAIKEEAIIAEKPEFRKAETFISKNLQDYKANSGDLAKSYESTVNQLIAAHNASSGKAKKAYRKTIEAVTHAYLDKVSLRNPDKLDKKSKAAIKNAATEMESAKIPTKTVLKNWKGASLKKELKLGVVDNINDTFKTQ